MEMMSCKRSFAFLTVAASAIFSLQARHCDGVPVCPFGVTKYGEQAKLYTLRGAGGLLMDVTDAGGRVVNLLVPDKNGKCVDVSIGFEDVSGWEKTDTYFGAIIGRFANRIADGRFVLDGQAYSVPTNDVSRSAALHGGDRGWDTYVWNAEPFRNGEFGDVGIKFSRSFPDGEQGFPGNVKVEVVYTVTPDNTWRVEFKATTDKATPLNMTQHVFLNMNGEGTILDHDLQIDADTFIAVDKNLAPVGNPVPVEGTPFDFRSFHKIGERIDEPYETLLCDPGYNHNWCLNGKGFRKAAVLKGRARAVEVWTDQPGLQFYSGNFIRDDWTMKRGLPMCRRGWLALETQHYPNSPNRPDFPSTILRPGAVYSTVTEFRFKALDSENTAATFTGDYPHSPAEMTNVTVTGGFWLPRIETNRLVTLKTDFEKCEVTRIPNFRKAAAREWGTFKGIPFDDSDVYKVIEGAAYSLATHPDAALEKYVDGVNAAIAGAQEPDGYLYTARTLGYVRKCKDGRISFDRTGPTRWSYLAHSHEFYNVGHLYEAAVAYWKTTGKRTLLDTAIKSADLIDRTFGPGPTQLKDTSGCEEIELALCKLYRATGEGRYLKLAQFLLDMRGRTKYFDDRVSAQSGQLTRSAKTVHPGLYCQSHKPVTEQREAVGHAVRAAYLYCGMADVAALAGNAGYLRAIDAIWENVVGRKLHLNGSIGARPRGEMFGDDYELPNETAYLETCAGIANALWNQRMFLMHGDAKYVDVMERVVYNGVISGVSLGGDEFFYPNPLASKGGYARSKWFNCACCPVNVVRFIPQIPQFAYATRGNTAYVNLFVESEASLKLKSGNVRLSQKTAYPWSGRVRIEVMPDCRFSTSDLKLAIRVPGWCVGRPVPSDLYVQTVPGTLADFSVKVNGEAVQVAPVKGYCVISREWKMGDVVDVAMNMPVRRIKAHAKVKADHGRLAVERGPVVYCAEGVDNGGRVLNKAVAADAVFKATTCDILGNRFPAFTVAAKESYKDFDGTLRVVPCEMKLVPYFAWCHRGAGEMQTWFPTAARPELAAEPFAVTASYCFRNDSVKAMMDRLVPKSSGDHSIPRHTFWDHKGTEEWAQCDFNSAREVKGVEVYWFDFKNKQDWCRVPECWRVQWRPDKNAPWRDVGGMGETAKDRFCVLNFPFPVKAQAIRLLIKLHDGCSGGILEWRIK